MTAVRKLKSATKPLSADGIVLFSVCQNEVLRLPYFLDYYRKLGVENFFIISHESTDGTKEYLSAQSDVNLFEATGSYWDSNHGQVWLRPLLEQYAVNRWTVLVDADELLKYPGSENMNLPSLTRQLSQAHYNGMFAMQLDLYSKGPIRKAICRAGQNPIEVCGYFDPVGHYVYENCRLELLGIEYNVIVGGVRARVFGIEPFLNKVPLIRFSKEMEIKRGTHFVNNVRFAPMQGCLLHLKYLSTLPDLVRTVIAQNDRGFSLSEYEALLSRLEREPDLSLYHAGSVAFKDTAQLCELGFMRPQGSPFIHFAVCAGKKGQEGWHSLYGATLSKWRMKQKLRYVARNLAGYILGKQKAQVPTDTETVSDETPPLKRSQQ